MSLILCEKHGQTGVINHISKDICEKIINDDPLQDDIKIVLIDLFDKNDFLYTITNYISSTLVAKHKLLEKYIIHNEEEEIILDKNFPKLSGLCGKCFREYVNKYNIYLSN